MVAVPCVCHPDHRSAIARGSPVQVAIRPLNERPREAAEVRIQHRKRLRLTEGVHEPNQPGNPSSQMSAPAHRTLPNRHFAWTVSGFFSSAPERSGLRSPLV